MRVLVTGGSGYIGSAVVAELGRRGHRVVALARSDDSANRLERAGCAVVQGSIATPDDWLPAVTGLDAVIHLAATFDEDMADADTAFVDALQRHHARIATSDAPLRLVYTGGVWLYGNSGDRLLVEGEPFDAPELFAWMVRQRERLFASDDIESCVVHPALVWDEAGGMIAGFVAAAEAGRAPQVVGAVETRWSVVHRRDVATLYALAAERGRHGADYHGVGETGVPVGDIAGAIARRFGAPEPTVASVDDAVRERGPTAAFQAFDQLMDAPDTRSALAWQPFRPGILETMGGGK